MDDGGKVKFDDEETNLIVAKEKEQKPKDDDLKDHSTELISRDVEKYSYIARQPRNGTIPEDILKFFYSYGYDCRKYFNLCVIDMDTVAVAAGNLIQFFSMETKKVWFKIGAIEDGIGHMSKNPLYEHIAVAENGVVPLITIYEWPSMNVHIVLKGGTMKRYFHLSYSPDGILLASQGGEPDYYISIWNWTESKIMLQCKSYVQDVYNITFSKYVPGQLTTSGLGHIKFWKMSRTFTGLKLRSEIGKFGNTEISDIIAIHPMPNETVISGCEWGNILLWDESLIKLEACRKNKETTHASYITQFEYINGELISVGSDGWIRFWFYETIDHANLSDDEHFLELQPIYEFQIMENEQQTMLMGMQRQDASKSEKTLWYAQDGNGGLWLLDLCTSGKEQMQKKIFTCHAGEIADMDVADWGSFMTTLDKNGHLHIYNYQERRLVVVHKFADAGSQVIWLPCEIEKTGSTLLCAFASGLIRMVTSKIPSEQGEKNTFQDDTKLVQVLKAHSMPITVMSFNKSCNLLVTASEDSTVFTFSVETTVNYPKIIPIGYVRLPSPGTCMTWHPREKAMLLVGCLRGHCAEIKLPITPQSYTTTTYELVKCSPSVFKFASVRSSIEREAVRQKFEEEKEKKLQQRRKELEQLRIENPHIVIDEETFFLDIEEEEMILPEIYIPEIPNRILVAQYGVNGNIWLFVAGYDAGYIYEYPRTVSGKSKHVKPISSRFMDCAGHVEMHNMLFDETKTYMILGTQYGELYITRIKEHDPTDFSDYWILPVHDHYNGHMPKFLFSYDKNMLLTCGYDGNIFSFEISDDMPREKCQVTKSTQTLHEPEHVEDIEDSDYPSLEEVITRVHQNRILAIAEEKKGQVLQIVRDLTEEYVKITERNDELLESQRISHFELDTRITEDLEQQLKAHETLTKERLKFQVEKSKLKLQKLMDHFIIPITCLPFAVYYILDENKAVYSLREVTLNMEKMLKYIELMKRYEKQQQTNRLIQEQLEERRYVAEESEVEYLEGLLAEDFSELSTGLGLQINQMLTKYKEKKARMIQRQKEWKILRERKPNLNKNLLEDEISLEKARQTIGEYNLKMDANFSTITKRETAAMKYKQLLDCRSKLHQIRQNFNERLKMIVMEKQKMQKEVIKLTEVLKRIHMEIPAKNVKPLPQPPRLNFDIEFPEHNLELAQYISIAEKMQAVKRQRQSFVIDQSVDHTDIEYEALYCDDKISTEDGNESMYTLGSMSKARLDDDSSAQGDLIKSLNVIEAVQTPWEREMKRSRMWRKIYEQDSILRHIETRYQTLENDLRELQECRLDVMYQSTYMNLNLLTLYEEFIILRDSEKREYALEERVNQKLNERVSMLFKMQETNVNIASREEEIKRLQIKIKDTATEFGKLVADNKFQDFLHKIFKKKYTAAKKQDGSSESESSESSSEESNGTIDSDAEYIPFDENICPQGCDRDLYEKAFTMRERRYEYEFQIKDEQREVELLQKDLDADVKQLKVIDGILKTNKERLQAFMIEKQKKLNDICVTVILKLHQLQHVTDLECQTNMQNCIVFNRKELSSLYARIGELQEETYSLEEKRKKNEIHLKRIKQDLKYMKGQNRTLAEIIKEKMIQKFGQKVSLINLYEVILQRLIYDTKTDVRTIMKSFAKDIKNYKRSCSEEMVTLENLIRNNTAKLSLLTVLEQEKYKLKKILDQTLISTDDMLQIELEHKIDIAALENLLSSQLRQKEMLKQDIENLKTGSKKLPSKCLP